MAVPFDPYHRWLGIPAKHQPADHYRLLGVERFESDREVIRDGADRQMTHVRTYQLGECSALSQKILNELAAARACLLNPERKAAYDARLQAEPAVSAPPVPPPIPMGHEAAAAPGIPKIPKVQTPRGRTSTAQRSPNLRMALGAVAVFLLGGLVGLFAGSAISRHRPTEVHAPPFAIAPFAIAPFTAHEAREHQDAWSKYLQQPREIENTIGMKFVLIPPGEFMMGSPESEQRRFIDEGPQHRVRITRPFYLGVYEVTQAQYEGVMGKNPSAFSRAGVSSAAVSGMDTRRLPVENVSWEHAVEFCRLLGRQDGNQYRLPTEAEWEYACRAGTTTPFHLGEWLNGRQANCDGNHPYGTSIQGIYLTRPTQVGSYEANAFGLHDMHGNVREWCADVFDSRYYATSPADDPSGPESGLLRVTRGGGWFNSARYCRSACRDGTTAGSWSSYIGFRVVLVATQ